MSERLLFCIVEPCVDSILVAIIDNERAARIEDMSVPERKLDMSVEEYLDFEAKSEERHEYLDGQVFAMSGATLRHNIISDNIHSLIKEHLKGSPCRSFIIDVKVRIRS